MNQSTSSMNQMKCNKSDSSNSIPIHPLANHKNNKPVLNLIGSNHKDRGIYDFLKTVDDDGFENKQQYRTKNKWFNKMAPVFFP